jgi:hypothetical protein
MYSKGDATLRFFFSKMLLSKINLRTPFLSHQYRSFNRDAVKISLLFRRLL